MLVPSRVMREKDYGQLKTEMITVRDVSIGSGGWPSVQHPHRHWEYALMFQTFSSWVLEHKDELSKINIADVGGGIGLTTPMFQAVDCQVTMYEPWVYGNESAQFWSQVKSTDRWLQRVGSKTVTLVNRPLCELIDEDKDRYDCAFCISTLEHIGQYQLAFRDLLWMVKPGGLVFLTTDYAEDEVDHYANANLRAGRMFNIDTYKRLRQWGEEADFEIFGGEPEWEWSDDCRLVNDSGFASLAMVRK